MEGEFFAMNDAREGLLVQDPTCPQLVQHTTVRIGADRPKDHIIWSILTFFWLGNPCCLGLAALVFSIKSRDQKVVGDLEGARHYGATARCLNIIATCLVVSLIVIAIIVTIVVVVNIQNAVMANYGNTYSSTVNRWGN